MSTIILILLYNFLANVPPIFDMIFIKTYNDINYMQNYTDF